MSKVYEITAEEQDAIIRAEPVHEGFMQTLVFYNNMLAHLRSTFVWNFLSPYASFEVADDNSVSVPHGEIHDWGCGYGDGTALLKATFPTCEVRGFDYASECINIARERWPHVDEFSVADVRSPDRGASIIFCSHLIEHMRDPVEVINRLRSLCSWLIVVVPPIIEGMDGGHEGALLTEDWLYEIEPQPLERVSYMTIRPTAEGTHIVEGNILIAMQGAL